MNSNPETVSTDYDTSSRLYFEPLTGKMDEGWKEGEREREREREREGGGGGGRKSVIFGLSRGRKKNGRMKKKEKLTHSRSRSLFPFTPPSNLHEKPKTNRKKKTVEDVLNVVEKCRPDGIIVQFGGQTPLKLATPLAEYLKANPIPAASGEGNVRIWGTQPESIDAAEDRDLWYELLRKLEIKQPPGTMVSSEEAALKAADSLGYPVMVRKVFRFFSPLQRALDARGFFVSEEGERKSKTKKKNTKNSLFSLSSKKKKKKKKKQVRPSFVLGGRAMEIVYSDKDLSRYIRNAVEVDPDKPVLVDKVRFGFFFFPFFCCFLVERREREEERERKRKKLTSLFFPPLFFQKTPQLKTKTVPRPRRRDRRRRPLRQGRQRHDLRHHAAHRAGEDFLFFEFFSGFSFRFFFSFSLDEKFSTFSLFKLSLPLFFFFFLLQKLQAGVHSGDSACSIPTQTISEKSLATIRDWTPKIARELKVVGESFFDFFSCFFLFAFFAAAARALVRDGKRKKILTKTFFPPLFFFPLSQKQQACSTSSTASRTRTSTSSRPTPAPRAPCRSSRKPWATRSPPTPRC